MNTQSMLETAEDDDLATLTRRHAPFWSTIDLVRWWSPWTSIVRTRDRQRGDIGIDEPVGCPPGARVGLPSLAGWFRHHPIDQVPAEPVEMKALLRRGAFVAHHGPVHSAAQHDDRVHGPLHTRRRNATSR